MSLIANYTYLILFKALRPARKKYRLPINLLLILNGCYLYQKHVKTAFSQYAIREFVTYYDDKKIWGMFKGLLEKKCIYESDFIGFQLYKVTEKGVRIVEELNEVYEIELRKFTEQYNITL